MTTARVHGKVAREYATSSTEVEWSCCSGMICGHARRTGVSTDGLAVYRLSGFRHPAMTGMSVVIAEDGSMVDLFHRLPVKRRCLTFPGGSTWNPITKVWEN